VTRPAPLVLRLAGLLAGVLACASLAGCQGSDGDTAGGGATPTTVSPRVSAEPSGDAAPAGFRRYAALGDSFSAGPLIPTTDLAGGCARSDHNYPSLVARALGVRRLVDVTCSGADTRDVTHAQHPFPGSTVPPQIRAVTRDTDLVTIGIGGNDLDLFATLIGTCTRLRAQDPTGSPCTHSLAATGPDLDTVTVTIAQRVSSVLRLVQRRAPHAAVVLVGYLRLAPEHGTCRGLPLAAGDYPEGRRIASTLNQALARAAAQTSTTYVDAYALSKGHDICSADPWVNGRQTRQDVALAYHPLEAGMRAVARQLVTQLQSFG
jgi:lysophospholipase L1-like esterase